MGRLVKENRSGSDEMQPTQTRSILLLAAEEQANLDKNRAFLDGTTYDLVSWLELMYDSLYPLCRFPPDWETNDATHAAGINGHLMALCRREFTIGILTLLRGYRINSLFHLRKAIELCTFAAKMARHPKMSRTWIQAANSDEEWKKFRDKFIKLFPEDDPELTFLRIPHDLASEAMHGNVKAVAHYLAAKNKTDAIPHIGTFDILSDAVLIASFITTVDVHLTILTVFERILKDYVPDITLWSEELHNAKVSFTAERQRWLPLVESAIIKNP
jgi:hypothetical protein